MIHRNHLAETIAQIHEGSLTVDEYLSKIKNRTEEIDSQIKSLLPESNRWSRLESDVEQLNSEKNNSISQSPLYGIPVGVKDIFHIDGFETKANSSLPSNQLTGPEANVVIKLKNSGALMLGKTVTTEFAYFEPGPTRNPHDTDHTPGGSSSGSAAAVAAGLCPIALGTQTVGSIIRPASFCGVIGFKPSYNRVSTKGVIPLSKSVDHVGFFTQDIAGADIAASVLCNKWQNVPKLNNKPTIGIPKGAYLEQASDSGLDIFKEECERLRSNGYEIKKFAVFDDIEEINRNHNRLVAAEAALAHHDWYQEYSHKYADETSKLIEEGYEVPTREIARGRRSRIKLRDRLTTVMKKEDIDVWIAPGACGPAPEGIDSTGDPIMNLPWTHAGLPTLGIPTGDTIDGLPIGVQCAGRFNSDEYLLQMGRQIEKEIKN